MAALQQQFQSRLTAHTSEHAEQQQKNKLHCWMQRWLINDSTTRLQDLRTAPTL